MKLQISAILVTFSMLILPWSSLVASNLDNQSEIYDYSVAKTWGIGGSNDTGWIDLFAEGADPINGTMAYADLFLDFAPGAIINNLTFEVAVNGSDDYWINQPQMSLMNTQTQIFDWSGNGDLGRQNSFSNNSPNVVNGVLDAPLVPNSQNDAYWDIPTGITITDLVIEALRPVDPRVSFSPLDITIHDTLVNPVDGSLFILADEDLLRLDNNSLKTIIDIEFGIQGRSLTLDTKNNQLIIGASDGSMYARDLSTSEPIINFPSDANISNSNSITSSFIDNYNIIWTASDCNLNYLEPGKGNLWISRSICDVNETTISPTDIIIKNNTIFLGTNNQGIHLINYTFGSAGLVFTNSNKEYHFNISNYLSSNHVSDLEYVNGILYISNMNAGMDRYDILSSTWLNSWSSNNWLSSNQIHGTAHTSEWLYIFTGSTVQTYNTNSMIFSSTIYLSDMGLDDYGHSINSWPNNNLPRSPDYDTILIGDSSGKLVTIVGEDIVGEIILATSPESDDDAQITAFIEDGEQGEIWISGSHIIDRFDKKDKLWKEIIDLQDLLNNNGGTEPAFNINEITTILQDSNDRIWIGTNSGLFELDINGNLISIGNTFSSSDYVINGNYISGLAHDSNTNLLIVGHPGDGISLINTTSNSVDALLTTSDGLDSDFIVEVATRFGIAYFATPDAGVLRIDLNSLNILGSWQSLGADDLDSTPVAVDGDIIYLGLPGFGLLLIDRITGEISDLWTEDDPNGIPDNDVISLSIDFYGGLLVGSDTSTNNNCWNWGDCGELARWDGSQWELLPTEIPGGNNDPYAFYDIISDSNGIYAGTNRGACMWYWPTANDPDISLNQCWNEQGNGGGNNNDLSVPSRYVLAVDTIGTDTLYAGTNEGAAVINTANGTVIDVWTAGDETERARILRIGDIVYLGFENTGIARYNMSSHTWLTPWDGNQGFIEDDDVTVIVPGTQYGTMWVGGDFGITLIDALNNTVLIDWERGTNTNGPTLPNFAPGDIIIIENIMYFSPQRAQSWDQRDEIYRINLDNNSSLSSLDAGAQGGFNGVIHGMNHVGNELWVSVRETGWWGNPGDSGTIVRWNITDNNWSDNLETLGDVERVNAQYLGDCFPITDSCELWVAYGEKILRRFSAENMTLLGQWNDVDGRIRGMVEFNNEYLFASMGGILRWSPVNQTWLNPWTPGDGLPSDSEEDFYSMEVVGDNLVASSGSYNDGKILALTSNSSNWTTWDIDAGDIPRGYGADIEYCDGIIHIAIGYQGPWWQTGGGIARFDTLDHDGDGVFNEWISPITTDNSLISDNDPRALACDESNQILYIGFDTEGEGIDRFNYNSNGFLTNLNQNNGISEGSVFPGGMLYHNGLLLVAHFGDISGITRISTQGNTASNGQILGQGMDACSIVRSPSSTSREIFAIGRSGQSSGINRVDRLDNTGLIEGGFDELVGLPGGSVQEIVSNSTHVWITHSDYFNSYWGSTILQGEILDNGSVNWQYGVRVLDDIINEMTLDNEKIWTSTVGNGLLYLNTTQQSLNSMPPALHRNMDGLYLEDDGTLYVGLMGYDSSSAGFQTFDTISGSWSEGSLIAGLPSNIVRDFVEYDDHILIATHGGIGMWNTTSSGWDDPITTLDGIPTSIIQHLMVLPMPIQGNGTVLLGSPSGLSFLDQNLSYINTLNTADGLIGDFVSGVVYSPATSRQIVNPQDNSTQVVHHDAAIFISHNGQGRTRPGVVAWDLFTDRENGTYNIDMIPSNDVRSITTDDWGVHIATDSEPLVHWNGTMMRMESGLGIGDLLSWPASHILSDGTYIALISPVGIDIIKADGTHSHVYNKVLIGIIGADIQNGELAVIAQDGLHLFSPLETLQESPREYQKRANPLTVVFGEKSWDITDSTHPGMSTVLATSNDSISISATPDSEVEPGQIPIYNSALVFTAPQSGAWVWAKSQSLNYTGSWDIASYNSGLQTTFQSAIFNTPPGSTSSQLHIRLQSPLDGKLQVRLTYDWDRLEAPTSITNLLDRPNDGGGILEATWLPAQDSAWHAYRLYVWDSTDIPDWTPEVEDLDDFATYERIPFWSETSAIISMANQDGMAKLLSDDRQYRAAISIEYQDGSLGQPMSWDGNATPSDEIPEPPVWLSVAPLSGGIPGVVNVEWSACTELDPYLTRIWAIQQEISNALALTNASDLAYASGNTTVLELEGNQAYWFAIVCVDENGQSSPNNATIFGPVVTAGGLNDGIPPAQMTDILATDVPNDEGGRIEVTWSPNTESDCSYYIVYALPASGFQEPTSVDGWPIAAYVPDCTIDNIIIDSIGESTFENGIVYWIGVVAVDDWGNMALEPVNVVSTTPYSETDSLSFTPPDRVTGLQAWDHPSDDGSAIDIMWNRSLADDFSHYMIWASEYPLNDLTQIYQQCNGQRDCNLITVDQRQIENSLQLEVTLENALYGDDIQSLYSNEIIPSIPLYVTVTIHDIAGNVYLSDMDEHIVIVSPIDNRGDVSPPDRMDPPILTDRDSDSGDGMFVEFSHSTSSDVAEYWIYAVAGNPFTQVNILEPALIISRNLQTPILLEYLSDGQPLGAALPIWVAVVPVDSSGNAWFTDLQTSMISLVDESILDPGAHLPVVFGIQTYWNLEGTDIEVKWDLLSDTQVTSYSVYYSKTAFTDIRNATLLSSEITQSMISFNTFDGISIDQSSTYWVAVVASDGEINRLGVNPSEVRPWADYTSEGGGLVNDGAGMSWFDQVMEGNMNSFIALISTALIFIGVVLMIKPKGKSAIEPWEMGTMEVEAEDELTRQDDDLETIMPTILEKEIVENDVSTGSELVDYENGNIPSKESILPSEVTNELLDTKEEVDTMDELNQMADYMGAEDLSEMADSLSKEDIDTTFLDDALEDQ